MGLDIYAGSLTRYYCRDWGLIAQRIGRETGRSVVVLRPDAETDEKPDPEAVRAAVLAWRGGLNEALRGALSQPLDWDESPGSPYFTDKPDWDGYSSLLLWAAYSENTDLQRPHERAEDWAVDPAYVRSSAKDFRTSYPSLLRDEEIWLPCDFRFCFSTTALTGSNVVTIGSSVALRNELAALNQRTWKADAAMLARWRWEGADRNSPLEVGARFAFAILQALTEEAVAHRLVLKLDY